MSVAPQFRKQITLLFRGRTYVQFMYLFVCLAVVQALTMTVNLPNNKDKSQLIFAFRLYTQNSSRLETSS